LPAIDQEALLDRKRALGLGFSRLSTRNWLHNCNSSYLSSGLKKEIQN